jgi:hypothetical protein
MFDRVVEQTAPADLGAMEAVLAPISSAEVAAVVADLRNPWPPTSPYFATYKPLDPSKWLLPRPPMPKPYVDFLRWSDGASWQTGEREFSCFGCKAVREYMLAYHFPEYMPGALPIGLDGGGVFGVFDLRGGPSDAVWAIESGALDWQDAVRVADGFVEFCRGRTVVGDVYGEGFVARRRET